MNIGCAFRPSWWISGAITSGFLFLGVAVPASIPLNVAAADSLFRTEKTMSKRQPSPSLASLPPPAAGGPLRILLVDDDWSDNNHGAAGGGRRSASDEVFQGLVAAAVGGDAAAWSIEIASAYKNGPPFERLRDFNVVLWYTGGSYGGGPDNVAVLSLEDEKTARRYLEETGGAFILVSPGYVNNLSYATTWTLSSHPFLKEVAGINGIAGLVQRFSAGQVQAHDGGQFTVEQKGAAEPQFSAVNPDGSAIVFTASLNPLKTAEAPVPVSVAHPFGRGRFVYVGFTFENISESNRTKAFKILLDAAFGSAASASTAATTSAPVMMTPVAISPRPIMQTITKQPEAPPGPPPANLEVTSGSAGWHNLRWVATGVRSFEVFRRDPDGWRFVKGGFPETFYSDNAFVAPNSAYKVIAVYADGRRGESIVEYPNPPQPERPTGLKVVQTGPETVQIDWINAPGVTAYRIFGPSAPDVGQQVTTPTSYGGRTTMSPLPIGIHEIRVAAQYGSLVAPIHASANVAVNSDRGRYRLVFLGVQVVQQANDDIFDGDGKGNELFAGAFWATTNQRITEPAIGGGFARTKVYGDTQGFPDRIRAGVSGATGGLRSGDYAPSANVLMPQPGVTALTDQFPLKLWEGDLVETGPAVAVVPIVFEWNATEHSAWSWWADYWSPAGNVMKQLGDAARNGLSQPLAPHELYGTWTTEITQEVRPALRLFNVAAGRDRPIGLINVSAPGKQPEYGHKAMGFVLTRSRVETALGGLSLKILQLPWNDAISGRYTGFFQLERLSEAPLVAPAATAPTTPVPTPTMTVQTIVPVVMATGVSDPAPATAGPSVGELSTVDRTIGTQTIKQLEAPPAGPPPTSLQVSSENAARHNISWAGSAATYDVFRQQGDRWILIVGNTTFTKAIDQSFVAPGTVYQVVARYADGRVGQAEITFANPAQPKSVADFTIAQTGERKAKLSWKMTSDVGVRGHRVFAPGLPADGQLVPLQSGTDQVLEISNVPEGTHLFRIAKQYDEKVAPIDARVTATMETWSGQYRFVLLGFRVQRKTTDDDIFDGDGRGDEVFFGAYRASLGSGSAATSSSLGFVQSAVLGDTNRFANRVRVGQAGPTGGIRSGDAIPSDAALVAQAGIATTNDRLPLLLWEGALSNDGGSVAVALTAFEWDNTSSVAWDQWKSWWSSPNGSTGLRVTTREALAASPDQIRFGPLTTTYEVEPTKPLFEDRMALPPPPGAGVPREKRYLAFMIKGRPIGNRPIGALTSTDPTYWYCVPHGFALSRANIEKTLGTRAAAVISASLRTHRGPEINNSAEEDEADYVIYLQIERTSGAPVVTP